MPAAAGTDDHDLYDHGTDDNGEPMSRSTMRAGDDQRDHDDLHDLDTAPDDYIYVRRADYDQLVAALDKYDGYDDYTAHNVAAAANNLASATAVRLRSGSDASASARCRRSASSSRTGSRSWPGDRTLTMADVNGNVVSTQDLIYQPNTTVDLLYPGNRGQPGRQHRRRAGVDPQRRRPVGARPVRRASCVMAST